MCISRSVCLSALTAVRASAPARAPREVHRKKKKVMCKKEIAYGYTRGEDDAANEYHFKYQEGNKILNVLKKSLKKKNPEKTC